MSDWELLRCPWCAHEQAPRPVEGKFVMPCSRCKHDDMEVYDLLPVRRRGEPRYVPTDVGVDRVLELREGKLHADDSGDRRDDRVPDSRPAARAAPAASTSSVKSRAYEPPTDPLHQNGELSIEPLLTCGCKACREEVLAEHERQRSE